MPDHENVRIKSICEIISSMPLSELAPKDILNYELLYRALKEKEIDYELLAKYGKPCDWFEDIAMSCANEEWFACNQCWKQALQAPFIEENAKECFEYPDIVNYDKYDDYYIENFNLYQDNIIVLQEELEKYKEIGLSVEELKKFLDIFKWGEFRDINLLMQMAQEVMSYRG